MRPVPLLERLLPFLAWPRQWSGATLRGDLIAGVTVALVMVPQSLAYAQLGSLPPYIGLYAALLPAVVGALFGSCGQLSTGPVALTALLTGASLLPLARPETPEFVALAILLALLSGLIQLALGGLRLGWLLNLLSHPVLMGFVNAAALIICLSQLPPLIGLSMARSDQFLTDLAGALARLDALHLPSAAFGLGALATLVALRRLLPRLPGVLLVVAAATALSALIGFEAGGGRVVGAIPAGLPTLAVPEVDLGAAVTLLPAAFVIALVSFMEVTSSARLISGRTRQPWRQNQELIGQGLAKIAAAACGSMPVSASFSRSALNHASGAQTGLSSLITAALVLLALLYFTPLLWHLPVPVLAAVILQAVANLIDFGALSRAWRANRNDGLAAVLTFVSTLAFAPNIQNGILTGLLLSLALMLYRGMKPRIALLGLHPDGTYRDLERFGLEHPHPRLVILRFDSPLTFVTAATFEEGMLRAVRAQEDVRVVLVSGAGINDIDATGLHTLNGLVERLRTQRQRMAFCGLKKQVIDAMERDGLWERLSPESEFRTEQQALDALLPTLDNEADLG
ncbi:SulP family inorganic anion transporter [Thauera sp. CAU 1555]|uniref:SulP family inorganic anion transporter n=1 Tax=Thauera sedimentorum TaxID=2767595 RepID=A0ABR9B6S0_9RHOO|nr:SulP family inorganic anion transporter [Thauera sedimentorum]MBC9071053.1 SulP family inorganic anion transporter [Thauera sedimentorum]MBD8501972.1 SulP family inorganic anion transporter [Thauera sedimentorum]